MYGKVVVSLVSGVRWPLMKRKPLGKTPALSLRAGLEKLELGSFPDQD